MNHQIFKETDAVLRVLSYLDRCAHIQNLQTSAGE